MSAQVITETGTRDWNVEPLQGKEDIALVSTQNIHYSLIVTSEE
jgi:hypothetical protein